MKNAAIVRVQTEIDRMFLQNTLPPATSAGFIQWIHNEFYRDVANRSGGACFPGDAHPQERITEIVMAPGQWRSRPEHDNAVVRHLPPSSERVADFMRYFEQRYSLSQLGAAGRIMAISAAHHRLNYIHPFPDGTDG